MRLSLAVIVFGTLAVLAAPNGCVELTPDSVSVSKADIEKSRDFLLRCVMFNDMWPAEAERLTTEHFNVTTPRFQEAGVCARYVHGLAPFIVVYPAAMYEPGCYEGDLTLLLAHEMLHQIGLPPHNGIRPDPIELVTAVCDFERS